MIPVERAKFFVMAVIANMMGERKLTVPDATEMVARMEHELDYLANESEPE